MATSLVDLLYDGQQRMANSTEVGGDRLLAELLIACDVSRHMCSKDLSEAIQQSAHSPHDSTATSLLEDKVLSESQAALSTLEASVCELTARCCSHPVDVALQSYHRRPEWHSDSTEMTAEPSVAMTAVGEHLLSLVPHMTQQGGPQLLSQIIASIVHSVLQAVHKISSLTFAASRQLNADLSYLLKLAEALAGADATNNLRNCLMALPVADKRQDDNSTSDQLLMFRRAVQTALEMKTTGGQLQ
eukprot:GHVS01003552.1.p1 GENE.GHVS01003552.1~~GHVS01003552.1.p1  ORF type:complete len:272 (+),score=47.52 GHVS01003552.1:82-816(+)